MSGFSAGGRGTSSGTGPHSSTPASSVCAWECALNDQRLVANRLTSGEVSSEAGNERSLSSRNAVGWWSGGAVKEGREGARLFV